LIRSTAGRSLGVAAWLAVASVCVPGTALGQRPSNELGRVMILAYHRIAEPEGRWTRSPAGFRRDLERLNVHGHRLVALNDVIDGIIDLPAGTSSVVLTFDDSSPGQFRYLGREGRLVIDPDCAVGILEAFHRAHPDFGHNATFYVLPGADQPHRLFGQPAHEGRKLRYLVSRGFEIGNHTHWHADLSRYPEATVRHQLALGLQDIQRLAPGYRVRTLALPMGGFPPTLGREWTARMPREVDAP
jgi:peptidoglycan/xylan/chitin deacetylase (PgdA/CDA1 family)